MLVKERMRRPVITIHPETTLPEALELMRKEHIRRLPVVNQRGQLVGIVSEVDLLKASPSEATTLSVYEVRELTRKILIEKIMTKDVITVTDDTPIEEAARIMADSGVSGLPVICDGKLTGIITETDLFKTFIDLLGGRDPGIRLTVMVPQGPGSVAKLSTAIFNLGGNIISLATSTGDSSETGQITVKVSGVAKEDLLRVVTPDVLRVVDVRDMARA